MTGKTRRWFTSSPSARARNSSSLSPIASLINDSLLDLACDWLKKALTYEGAGAKTAAGYGRFKPVQGTQVQSPSTITSKTYDLRLVSPAFLAGAYQKKEDCDLRPATLRGLLRWWWRTMHADHLDRDTLKRLETAVWGDAEAGSPVRIAVDFVKCGSPEKYDYKNGYRPKTNFKLKNKLTDPPNNKTTQGLFYASYGMDDERPAALVSTSRDKVVYPH